MVVDITAKCTHPFKDESMNDECQFCGKETDCMVQCERCLSEGCERCVGETCPDCYRDDEDWEDE